MPIVAALVVMVTLWPQSQHVAAQSGGASITTDKQTYQVGEPIRICYRVPGPGPITITDVQGGSSKVIISGNDDGTGGCINGTITPPTGQECFRLDYRSSRGSGSTQTCIIVGGPASGGMFGICQVGVPSACNNPGPQQSQPPQSMQPSGPTTFPSVLPLLPSLTASPTLVESGQSVTAAWADFMPSGNDWISLHPTGAPDSNYLGFQTIGGTQGSKTFAAPTNPGTYEFRLFRNGQQWVISNTFQVQAAQLRIQVSIKTDKLFYRVGELLQLCYTVSQPLYIRITDFTPDGQSRVLIEGMDDGRGDCRQYQVTPPLGSERIRIEAWARQSDILLIPPPASQEAGFEVLPRATNEESPTSLLTVVEPLTLSTTNTRVGQTITARFVVRNTGSIRLVLDELTAAARKGSDWSGEWADFPHVGPITLDVNQTYTYQQSRMFDSAGSYFAEPSSQYRGSWGGIDGGNRASFNVNPPQDPSVARGTVAGFVSWSWQDHSDDNLKSARVRIIYQDGGRVVREDTVYDLVDSVACIPYVLLFFRWLPGDCFIFHDVPKDQNIVVQVYYDHGPLRILENWFSDWEPVNWMGTTEP
jgi:hypothetical protein